MHTLAVARTVHGTEPLVAAEIHRSRLGSVRGLRHREVWFDTADPGPGLLGLRTADDVLLVAAVVDGVGHGRLALRRLSAAARALRALRALPPRPLPHRDALGVEVSATFVGRRAYTRHDIEDAVGAELGRRLRLPYHSRTGGAVPPAGCLAFRVTIEGERAVIGLRLAARPLHRRPYKLGSVPGSLHPPLAAAMAALARLDGARTVLDPCCGAGTTLLEAAALAPHARFLGLDHNPAAITAATTNATHLHTAPTPSFDGMTPTGDGPAPDRPRSPENGHTPRTPAETRPGGPLRPESADAHRPPAGEPAVTRAPAEELAAAGAVSRADGPVAVASGGFWWGVADGGRVPLGDGVVDRVLVNPPWGRQVAAGGLLAGDPGRLWREVRRVLAADGLVVALVHDGVPDGFTVRERVRVSLSGRHPELVVLSPGRARARTGRGR
ncbi:methyltransferase domain-containing protein [Nonomuraea sp. NPDC049725]|uniref:methyltransferase domain-containing protein n=1 Tax=Nonomuraea sp. NPDC049725 TaxID=3154508 RepID=UPI00343D3AB4